ncbi:hypothetical protein M2139_002506 [Enterococcus sp. PF1-24]|uniref:DUF58 domain-containing protein n=1 Tax=unclassified Enterococcus TaxID=2608891 RepID=UPI0024760C5D|nr:MULTISPECIES: DUF58 domain-containing protein [unclassified Enterococcus]MDH6365501.1 hypothetical protein [Enterococcus sp. PFB1-1]MDH6402602.1 hypothetical protein [Enterococcus sp. PF1-24]
MKLKSWQQFSIWLLRIFIYLAISLYAILSNNPVGWNLFFLLHFILLTSALLYLTSLKTLKAEITSPRYFYAKKPTTLNLTLLKEKNALLPIPQLEIHFPKWLKQSVAYVYFFNGVPKEIKFTWSPPARGVYQELQLTLIAHDLFNLFSKKIKINLPENYLVLPGEHLQGKSYAQQVQQQLQRQKFGQTNYAIKNFRPYQSGDSLKHIDWKLSSKQQELLFKEYESEGENQIDLIFWGNKSKNFEGALSFYYTFQENLQQTITSQQLLVSETAIVLPKNTPAVFATLKPFKAVPKLPDFYQKKLIIIAPKEDSQLTTQLTHWQKNNQITFYNYQKIAQNTTKKQRRKYADKN